jgi:hypothetical protein
MFRFRSLKELDATEGTVKLVDGNLPRPVVTRLVTVTFTLLHTSEESFDKVDVC